jgi:hypothetical protein
MQRISGGLRLFGFLTKLDRIQDRCVVQTVLRANLKAVGVFGFAVLFSFLRCSP